MTPHPPQVGPHSPDEVGDDEQLDDPVDDADGPALHHHRLCGFVGEEVFDARPHFCRIQKRCPVASERVLKILEGGTKRGQAPPLMIEVQTAGRVFSRFPPSVTLLTSWMQTGRQTDSSPLTRVSVQHLKAPAAPLPPAASSFQSKSRFGSNHQGLLRWEVPDPHPPLQPFRVFIIFWILQTQINLRKMSAGS